MKQKIINKNALNAYEGVSKFSEIKIFQNLIYGETYIGIFIEVIQFGGGGGRNKTLTNVFRLI